jgi:4-amino-4-deoxy-L-arabinose transferase-like glycosyltransferase
MNASVLDRSSKGLVGWHARDALAIVVLVLVALISALLIGVQGDFPLSDDWAYSQTVRTFIDSGLLERVSWTWAPVLSHTWWGASFAWVLGYSQEVLRMSGVLMGCLSVLGTFALCRQVGLGTARSLFGGLVVACNPLHVNLSHTFMMDVPFTALMTWSLVCHCRWFVCRRFAWFALGAILAVAATLSRQVGMAVPVAVILMLVVLRPERVRYFVIAIGSLALIAVAYFVVPKLVFGGGDSATMFGFGSVGQSIVHSGLHWHLITNLMTAVCYFGAFVSPIVLVMGWGSQQACWLWGVSGLLTCASLGFIQVYAIPMPIGMNVIYDLGLGARSILGSEGVSQIGRMPWFLLTGLGFLSGYFALALLMVTAWRCRLRAPFRMELVLLALVVPIYLAPLVVRSPFFDRYLLPALPPLLALLLGLPCISWTGHKVRRGLSAASLLLLGCFSVAGSRDYMERNRAVWSLVAGLRQAGVDDRDINGGFEFLCWTQFKEDSSVARNWMKKTDMRYLISLADSYPGYRVVKSRSFLAWLLPHDEVLRVFERVE